MFKQVLFTQWKWSRTELLSSIVVAFVMPTLVIRIGFSLADVYSISNALDVVGFAGALFASVAVLSALALAWRPYVVDATLRHVGPLTLPVAWPAFVRMRFVAGALLLLLPTLAIWLGGLVATAAITIPPTLHAYPGGIALRFLIAALVAYAAGFALQYLAGKQAVRVALILFALVAVIELAANAVGYDSFAIKSWNVLTTWPGPFAVFGVRWMLIDV
jgi:hypothetical protein